MGSEFGIGSASLQHEKASRGSTGGKTRLLLLIGGAALLLVATAGAAFFIGMTTASPPLPQTIATNRVAAPPAPAAAPATPPAPQWTTIGTFGSWEARCTPRPGSAARFCTAVLQVIDNRNKSILMAWIVGPDEKGALQTIFQTPTGVMVSSGVNVKLGNAAVRKINFQSCATQQCTAVAPMNDAFVKEVGAAEKAEVTVTAMNGQALNFGIPVAGLDKALAAIKK